MTSVLFVHNHLMQVNKYSPLLLQLILMQQTETVFDLMRVVIY